MNGLTPRMRGLDEIGATALPNCIGVVGTLAVRVDGIPQEDGGVVELRPGYKLTDVGVIPAEWQIRSIGQMFKLSNGCAFKPADWKQSGAPIIRIQNLNDPYAPFNYSQAPVDERNRVESGDLLFAWSGTIGTSFGARVWAGPTGVLNQHIFKVLMDERQITLPFSLLVFARVEADIAKQAHGFKASFVHVKKSDLVKVSLPVPPIPEQRAIATALSDVDALLEGLDRLIAKKQDLKQAAMQQLLTGQTRLPGFHGAWEDTTLGQIGECVIGLTYRPENVVAHGLLVLRSSNVQNGRLSYADNVFVNVQVSENLRAQLGDILVCVRNGSRALIGKCALIDPPAVGLTFGAFMSVYRTRYWRFAFHAFQAESIQRQIRDNIGATINQITNKDMKAFRLKLPPEDEQVAIAEVLSVMDREIIALEARRDKTRDLKQAMMQELLAGRTRLVPTGAALA